MTDTDTLPSAEQHAANLPVKPAAHPNFFAPIAELMTSIPASLEASATPDGPPRYIRIARLRPFLAPQVAKSEPVAGAIADGVGYFITGMLYVQKYAIKLQDLLVQGDAGKALIETALALAETVTDDRFLESIEVLNKDVLSGQPLGLAGSMGSVKSALGSIQKYVGFIPDPADLDVVGLQLYRMLVIEWVDAPAAAARKTERTPVDMTKTGKLRLLMWALNRPYAPLFNDRGSEPPKIRALGMRRLSAGDTLSNEIEGSWKGEVTRKLEPVFQQDFKDGAADIGELQELLKAYGYPLEKISTLFDKDTQTALAQFQKMNELPVTGELDLPTVNQLFHLHYDPDPNKGRLRKAARYDENALKTFVWPAKDKA